MYGCARYDHNMRWLQVVEQKLRGYLKGDTDHVYRHRKKLKGVAIVNLIFGIVIALACLVIMEEAGILIAPAALLTSLISSWFIYAFAELLENTKRISHALQVVFAEDISKDLERQKQLEKQKKRKRRGLANTPPIGQRGRKI